jgi:hypothetical protein
MNGKRVNAQARSLLHLYPNELAAIEIELLSRSRYKR